MHINLDQLRWHRLTRSGLINPFSSAEECAEALIGIQAQVPRAAALAIASRTGEFSFTEFEFLLYERRSLIRTWGQRDTFHVYRTSDWPKLVTAFCERRSWAYTKFRKDGGSDAEYERLLRKISETLNSGESLTRDEISNQTGIDSSSWGGFLIDAAYRGFIADAGKRRFSHGSTWFPNLGVMNEREDIYLDLVRRYLHCYGPARAEDIAFWFKERITVVKNWLAKLDLIDILCDGVIFFALQEDYDAIASLSPPPQVQSWPIIFLYRFDPLLLAHKVKNWIVPADYYTKVWTAAGHVSGVILQKGVATAIWRYKKRGNQYSINVVPFAETGISQSVKKEVIRYEKFLQDFF